MSSEGADEVERATRLVPKRRFPEFMGAGEWEHRSLGSLAKILDERVGNKPLMPYSITSGIGLVSQQEKFGRMIAGTQLKNYVVVQNQDFAYNKSATKEYPQGFAVMFENDTPGCVPSSIFTCFRVEDGAVSPPYLNYLLRGNLHGRWLANYSAVGARANGSLAIDDKDLLALPVPLPKGNQSLKEQEKIADCLSSLDAVIAAEGDRLAALREYKRGLMQQLFPHPERIEDGEKVAAETAPRLRFPEFRKTGAWEERPLSTCIKLVSGLHLAPDEYSDTGEIPYFSGPSDLTNVQSEVSKWTSNTGNVALQGDILVVVKGSGVGDFFRLAISRVAIGRQLMAIRATAGRQDFVMQALATKADLLRARATGNLIPGLARPDILDLRVFFPPTEEEQGRVAETVSGVDSQIAALIGKLQTLKAHKSGLMQQLFPLSARLVP